MITIKGRMLNVVILLYLWSSFVTTSLPRSPFNNNPLNESISCERERHIRQQIKELKKSGDDVGRQLKRLREQLQDACPEIAVVEDCSNNRSITLKQDHNLCCMLEYKQRGRSDNIKRFVATDFRCSSPCLVEGFNCTSDQREMFSNIGIDWSNVPDVTPVECLQGDYKMECVYLQGIFTTCNFDRLDLIDKCIGS